MEKEIIVYLDNKEFLFTTEKELARENKDYRLVDILTMSELVQWLEKIDSHSKRVKCVYRNDIIIFKDSIKYVEIIK